MVAMIREADREPVSVVGKWARSRRSTHGASVSGAFRRTCGADEGAVGAVSALRLSSHPHLSRARRLPHEPWPGISAVAGCWPAVGAQATVTDEVTKEGMALDVDGRLRSAHLIEGLPPRSSTATPPPAPPDI